MRLFHTPVSRDIISKFLCDWENKFPGTPSSTIATSIATALYSDKKYRENTVLEPVWSGPKTSSVPLRRTEQALIEVINASKESILIVSFAVYKINSIIQALIEAYERKVDIKVILETPESGVDKIDYDTINALGEELIDKTKIYFWPLEMRPKDAKGNAGSFHAKCALADKKILLISSANLTQYALELNMELGVLIKRGTFPNIIAEHFDALIREGIFKLHKEKKI